MTEVPATVARVAVAFGLDVTRLCRLGEELRLELGRRGGAIAGGFNV